MQLKNGLLKLIKDHKTTIMVIVVAFIAYRLGTNRGLLGGPYLGSSPRNMDMQLVGIGMGGDSGTFSKELTTEAVINEASPASVASSRMYEVESMLSMVVLDVDSTALKIQELTQEKIGGYLVSKHINNQGESSDGSITVRIPAENKDAFLTEVKTLGLRVVNETIDVGDITDTYTNYEKQLEPLQKANEIFYNLLKTTTDVNEVLRVQQAITNTQKQIDRIEGQMRLLEKQSQTTLITIYISTNENTLPYIPNNGWSLTTVIKEAIRSLVLSLQSITGLAVRIAVFSVIWAPVLALYLFIRKMMENKKKANSKKVVKES